MIVWLWFDCRYIRYSYCRYLDMNKLYWFMHIKKLIIDPNFDLTMSLSILDSVSFDTWLSLFRYLTQPLSILDSASFDTWLSLFRYLTQSLSILGSASFDTWLSLFLYLTQSLSILDSASFDTWLSLFQYLTQPLSIHDIVLSILSFYGIRTHYTNKYINECTSKIS